MPEATAEAGPSSGAPASALATANHGLYTRIQKLGEGSFGCISLIKHNGDGGTYVLKEMALAKLSPKEVAACRLEMDVLKRFNHPNVISFVSSFEEPGLLGILMEYASGGDLQRLIDARIEQGMAHLSEWRIKGFILQLGGAIAHIHSYMLLLHRDIKPANVFLTMYGDVRLGDFGMCKLLPCSRINMIPREDARNTTAIFVRRSACIPRYRSSVHTRVHHSRSHARSWQADRLLSCSFRSDSNDWGMRMK